MKVNVHQAKTHFSRLLRQVADGEEVTIARAGVPVARLVRVESNVAKRPIGMDQARVRIAEDFDAPLPPNMLALFLGSAATQKGKSANRNRDKTSKK